MKKEQILVAILFASCFTLIVEGKPQLYSCDLQITNGSHLHLEYKCNHDFEISEDGAKIPSNGVRGFLTNETGFACTGVEAPQNASLGWAVVVKYNDACEEDCSLNQKAFHVWKAGYRMVLLVGTSDCEDGSPNNTNYDVSSIPIILPNPNLSGMLLRYSQLTSDEKRAAEVFVEAVYVDFALLWTVFGITVAITITSTISCFCIFFVFRGLAARFKRQGLSRWSLRKLPQRKYVKGKESYETCAICLEEFEDADTVRVLPCSHIYHSKCVDEWLMKWNRVCPICKRVILRNEKNEDQVSDAEGNELSSPGEAPLTAAADNLSDSGTVESIPLLVSIHDSTSNGRTNRYGSVAEGNGELAGDHYLLEACASMQTTENNTFSTENSNMPESDHAVTV